MKNIKAVIFDLDNTLGNRFVYSYKMFKHILLKYNPEISSDPLLMEAIMQDYCTYDEDGIGDKETVFARLQAKYNLKFEKYDILSKYWAKHIGDYFEVFDGTYQLLDYLKEKYILAVITNGDPVNQLHKIEIGKLNLYFNEIIVSKAVGCKKPDKEIFEMMCQRLHVEPNQAVYIGDNFYSDILGAKKANLHAIWLNHNKRISEYPIETIVDIKQLKNIL